MRVADLSPHAHALTIFRALDNGDGRAYTAVTFPQDPRGGCLEAVRRFAFIGQIVDWGEGAHPEDSYGVLDVLDADGDIIQDYAIPTAQDFQAIKRRLNLRVDDPGASGAAS